MGFASRALETVAQPVMALAIGLAVAALLMAIYGYDPVAAYRALFIGAYGTPEDLMESIAFAVPIMLTGITFAIGLKAGLFNIGAEGQLYMGAIGAVIAGAFLSLPWPLHVIVATLVGMLFGLLWSVVPALLKVFRGVHEVISTIMFNWIAFYLATYLVLYRLAEPGRAEKTYSVLETARYGILFEGTSLTSVVFVALAFVVGIHIFLGQTKAGFELRTYGLNPDAAKFAGISEKKVIVLSFLIGGLAAGLAGASQVLGRPPTWALYGTLGNVVKLGFDGIGVALIGRNHPIGIIFASLFVGGLLHGGRYMEIYAGVYSELVDAVTGLIIIALAVPEVFEVIKRYRLKRKALGG
ncbi:MAG: ABC transporter permease [Desulfurococcales archaeon]|nr:ABC transporter permease [Desulfurococcales archaeon]